MTANEIYRRTSDALETSEFPFHYGNIILIERWEDRDSNFELWYNAFARTYSLDAFCKTTEKLYLETEGLSAEDVEWRVQNLKERATA